MRIWSLAINLVSLRFAAKIDSKSSKQIEDIVREGALAKGVQILASHASARSIAARSIRLKRLASRFGVDLKIPAVILQQIHFPIHFPKIRLGSTFLIDFSASPPAASRMIGSISAVNGPGVSQVR